MVSLFDSLSKDLPKIAIITSLALLVKIPAGVVICIFDFAEI